jgi:hypothetical protein
VAGNDASRVAPGTVPGTAQEVIRKACSEAFLAGICGSILEVRREVFCRLNRKEVRRAIRAASRCQICRARGKAVVTATRRGTVDVVCRGSSEAISRTTRDAGFSSACDTRKREPSFRNPETGLGTRSRPRKWGQSPGGTVPIFGEGKRQLSLPQTRHGLWDTIRNSRRVTVMSRALVVRSSPCSSRRRRP